jgi:CubicO group peptidase (beta-lactamase class C family)
MLIESRINYLEEYIDRLIKKGAFPGACFGLVTKVESYYKALGNAQQIPVIKEMREDSIFDIASLTKVITTTPSILILIKNGELRIGDKVKNILPKFKHENTTILQLLTHSSGLPADVKFYKLYSNTNDISENLYKTDLIYNPASKVLYSDLNFILLGLIVEKLAERLDRFASKYIFTPLEMTDTCFNPSKEKIERIVATEFREERGIVIGAVHDGNSYAMGGISGHAGVFSTVSDLGKFSNMILSNGFYKTRKVLDVNSINLMNKCYTEGLEERRGLGWKMKSLGNDMGDLVSERSLFHTGFTGTSILIDREKNLGFILLTNRIHPTRRNEQLLELRGRINNIAITTI